MICIAIICTFGEHVSKVNSLSKHVTSYWRFRGSNTQAWRFSWQKLHFAVIDRKFINTPRMDTITVDAIAQHIHADIQEKKKKKA
jgi:hypothetical protein